MRKIIQPDAVSDTWSAEALYAKSVRYSENMTRSSSDSWEHALWSGLTLELLARATLSNISPAFLADVQNQKWGNLANALGFPPFEAKFSAKSIGTSVVFARLRQLLPDFDTELEKFCVSHVGRRNEELHTGALPYDGVHGSSWHGPYFRALSVLLASMGFTLVDFIGEDQASAALIEMEAEADEAAQTVFADVETYRKNWDGREESERAKLAAQAELFATRDVGHGVVCPACKSAALVVGEPVGSPSQILKNDMITESQEHLPQKFQCIACGLKIVGLSKLRAVELGDRYKKEAVYEAADYYASEDPYWDFEDDNNEPF